MGELISICVAFSWTICALFFEFASKRLGSTNLNLIRLVFAFIFLGVTLFFMSGSFLPIQAGVKAWIWMLLSGLVGFVLGDYFLFNAYALISARYGQLFMTLAPPFAALFGFLLLQERLSFLAFVGMLVTLFGIGLSIFSKEQSGNSAKLKTQLPLKGIIYGILAALGQGGGIVLSKIGMNEYSLSLNNSQLLKSAVYIPFSATMIRIIAGIIGFIVMIAISSGFKNFFVSCKDSRGVAAAFGGSIFGPFIGVSLSLLAVRYTNTAIASTIMALVPIFILVPEKFYYKRKVTARQLIGAIISVAGVTLFFI